MHAGQSGKVVGRDVDIGCGRGSSGEQRTLMLAQDLLGFGTSARDVGLLMDVLPSWRVAREKKREWEAFSARRGGFEREKEE
jgi:hypothetical protein